MQSSYALDDANTAPVEGALWSNLFVDTATVTVKALDYGSQASDETWDSGTVIGQTAQSLADRANADFTSTASIMRFLHDL